MDTNAITNLVFVAGAQYYYDPNAIYVCGMYFFEGVIVGMFFYAVGNVLRWWRCAGGGW